MEKEAVNCVISNQLGWLQQGDGNWRRPDGQTVERCPDWYSDLNAMHEAEKWLDEKTGHSSVKCLIRDYWLELMNMLNPDEKLWNNGAFLGSWANAIKVGHATAAQRAEAFLRVIGRWKE